MGAALLYRPPCILIAVKTLALAAASPSTSSAFVNWRARRIT